MGRERAISLGHNRLTGPLPAAIAELTRLRKLILNNNAFSGTIYQIDFSGLRQMQEMCINNNQLLSGALPDTIGCMTSLYTLTLQSNKFNSALPSSFSNLIKLSNLNLSNNALLPIDQLKLQKVLSQCNIVLKETCFY